jgi:hypothetical protein
MHIFYKNFGMDSKGVLQEFGGVVAIDGIVVPVVYLLVIFDPGNLEYNNKVFNWNCLHVFVVLGYQLPTFWWQLYISHREQKPKVDTAADKLGDLREVLLGAEDQPATVGL